MSANPDVRSSGSPLDTAKLVLAVLVLLAGIVFYYYFQGVPHELAFGYRVGGVLVAVVLALGIASRTVIGQSTWVFLRTSRMEVRKVVWPNRQETFQTTMAVIVMVILLGIFMWLLDMLFFWALQGVAGQGG